MFSQKGATETARQVWGAHAPGTYVLLALVSAIGGAVIPTLLSYNVSGCEGTLTTPFIRSVTDGQSAGLPKRRGAKLEMERMPVQ